MVDAAVGLLESQSGSCIVLDDLAPGMAAADQLLSRFAAASDAAALRELASQARDWVRAAVGNGLGSQILMRAFSGFNDALTKRALVLIAPRHRLPPAPWCWLGLGSEGRQEQTLATDQDNALVFQAVDGREADALRQHFLPFAHEVNQLLAGCGIPLCEGEVMAGNPHCCLSLGEWQESFNFWMRLPEPAALLNGAIFFDLRPVHGDHVLASELRRYLCGTTCDRPIFLHLLAHNALQAVPPLGRLTDFVTTADVGGTLDLKKLGTRIFVDGARVLALANGVGEVGTVERLDALARVGRLPSTEAAAARQAFLALQSLRFDNQIRRDAGDEQGNRLIPDQLNSFERSVLLSALRQARSLQRLLKSRFSVES
jgi:CBS domain-containing protein